MNIYEQAQAELAKEFEAKKIDWMKKLVNKRDMHNMELENLALAIEKLETAKTSKGVQIALKRAGIVETNTYYGASGYTASGVCGPSSTFTYSK